MSKVARKELFETLADILLSLARERPFLTSPNESPDGRLLENAGPQNCGSLPMNLLPEIDQPSLVHGENERVSLASISFGADAIFERLRRY